MFMFVCCRILASLRHPHIVAFYESFSDADEQVVFIIQVSCQFNCLCLVNKTRATQNSFNNLFLCFLVFAWETPIVFDL